MKKTIISIFCVLCLMLIPIYSGTIKDDNIVYADTGFKIDAKACLLVDDNFNTVMYEQNSSARFPIASMVKLMTILLTYEALDNNVLTLDTKITTTENASKMGGSQVFIDPYVDYKTEDLLKSVIMASANDASVALAEYISGSESEFVAKMNKKAQELKMNNTLYANCTGLPAPEQYSCAHDCAIILKEVSKYEHYHKMSKIWMDTLTHPSGRKTELVNTNKLVRYYKGCTGGKTGSTNEAGYCLSAIANKNGLNLIAVVIGAKTGQERFKQTTNLFNYGFANFDNKTIINVNEPILVNQEVNKGKIKTVDLYACESYDMITKKGENKDYEISYDIQKLVAPIKSGDKVGTLIISKQGKVLKEIDVVVKQEIKQISLLDSIHKIAEVW